MESFFSRYKNALVLIVVLVAQLLALAVQVKRPAPGSPDQEGVSLIRYVVVSVVTPPERWVHNIGSWIGGLWSGYVNLVHVRREDATLKTEIERLRLEQASLAEDAKQGQRLQQLLDFKQRYIYKTLPAQVIGASGTDQSRTLYIDKGSKEGLAADMPVVTADGIVGKLKDVFDHKSLVVLINDPTSGVGVMLETTRTRGILKGAPFGQLQVINVSPDDRIKAGERIVTSGGDQIFPRGMPVGTVERVVPDPDRDPLVDVAVQPAANLARLEEVLVITNLGDIPSAQAAKDLAQSEAEGEAEKKRASDVLSERLPSRLDAKAPADTNPDQNAAAAGAATAEDVRVLTPPKPLRPDQYSPDATPQATEMTPGQRRAPVLQGTEDIVVLPKKPAAAVAVNAGTGGSEASPNGGNAGTARRTATDSAGGSATTGGSATGVRTAPGTAGSRPASGTGSPTTGITTAGTTTTGTTTGSARQSGAGTATSAGTLPRPANPNGTGVSRPAAVGSTPSSASTLGSGTGAAGGPPKTRVIVDGPMPSRASTSSTSPSGSRTAAPESAPAAPVRKGPILVPDDGSRPPSAMKPVAPKPKPVQNAQPAPATSPNGGR